jgi:hypothetical protein
MRYQKIVLKILISMLKILIDLRNKRYRFGKEPEVYELSIMQEAEQWIANPHD